MKNKKKYFKRTKGKISRITPLYLHHLDALLKIPKN